MVSRAMSQPRVGLGVLVLGAALWAGCGSSGGDETPTSTPEATATPTASVPATYSFSSRFGEGSSVSYSGQVLRQILILDLDRHIQGLTGRLDTDGWAPGEGEVVGELNTYYAFDSAIAGELPIGVETDPASLQEVYDDVSTGKDLVGKIAGNDAVGQHEDWSVDFVGWEAEGVTTPDELVRHWFDQIEAQAIARANGQGAQGPSGLISVVQITPEGQDLRHLLRIFLQGAVSFSQAADDYLDDDLEDKGLNSPNTRDGDAAYTVLEHAWDEAFGYFGAAQDMGAYTDEELAARGGRDDYAHGWHDTNADGAIDLTAEMNFGHAVSAAKRDLGSAVTTDFTASAWEGFLVGRAIISGAGETLLEAERVGLAEARDQAVLAWEQALAASAIHYINEVLVDMGGFGTEGYDFEAHAGHWSEMKAYTLILQFNPRSPLSDADFATLQAKVGQAPVLPGQEGVEGYHAALLEARTMLGEAYGFDVANLGDDDGAGGW